MLRSSNWGEGRETRPLDYTSARGEALITRKFRSTDIWNLERGEVKMSEQREKLGRPVGSAIQK
jgi:hypothetical protein